MDNRFDAQYWERHPPVFFVGMPRSGTTVVFEAFARHDALAWPSNYSENYPEKAWLNRLRRLHENGLWRVEARKGEFGTTMPGNRFFVQPDEAYSFWNRATHLDFAGETLAGVTADSEEAQRVREACLAIVRAQGRTRFSAKFTGPPRTEYLNSVFPNARFVHVVRDGRAVVRSLLRVKFWKDGGGFTRPFWGNCIDEQAFQAWKNGDADPGVLAAMQWHNVISATTIEGKALGEERFMELRYEDYIDNPMKAIEAVLTYAGLSNTDRILEYLDKAPTLINMNHQFRDEWSADYIERLSQAMGAHLKHYGYA